MPGPYQHIQKYQNFFGIDLKTNDLEFQDEFATVADNVNFSASGTLEKRKGYFTHGTQGAKFGIFTYNRVNSSGVEVPEVIGVSNSVQKLVKATLQVSYSGSQDIVQISIRFYPDTGVYRCVIIEQFSTVLDFSLGIGDQDPVPVTVGNLVSQINAIANFSASASGDTGIPASFLNPIDLQDLTGGPVSTYARYWSSLNVSSQTGKAGPLQGSETNKNQDNFENVTSVQLQNCIYFSNGYDPVLKYDGQNVYRAGLPPASDGSDGAYTITAVGAAGPAAPPKVYVWRQQFIQIDANGNFVEGNTVYSSEYSNFLEPTAGTAAAITVSNIQAGSGFNTNCAIVAGAQVIAGGPGNKTITVDNGSGGNHTMKSGDTAFFRDSVLGNVTYPVVSVATGTITVDSGGAAVNVADNAVISNNLRIKILRNQNTNVSASPPFTSPTLWFEVVEIANNSFAATQVYSDVTPDASLVSQFIEPATDRSPPRPGKYISSFLNLMVTAGNLEAPNEVSFSDFAGPEYFPLVANQFTVSNTQGDIITGIHPSSETFLIFQRKGIHAVTGDIPNQSFRVDNITQDIGCVAHATIEDVRGKIFFLSEVGPRVMAGNSLPVGLGVAAGSQFNSRVDPIFNKKNRAESSILRTKRAIARNDTTGEKYIIFIPAESSSGSNNFTNINSIALVYDYTRDSWVKWTNVDFTGGITKIDDDMIFVSRKESALVGTINYYVSKMHNSDQFFDYQDHVDPIDFDWRSKWEFMGNAAVLKNFQRIRIYSVEDIDSDVTIGIETEKNFVADSVLSSCSVTFEGNGYGLSEYGASPYGDPSNPDRKHKLSNGRVYSLRIGLLNSQDQTNVAITGYELEVSLPYQPAFKR
jgi:hypothetical protein